MKDQERKDTNKVVLFDIDDAMLEDEKMDQFLKESIMKEADEIEEALNNDPDLTGYGASDDMFQAIVDQLKQQGVWEEEDAEHTDQAEHTNQEDQPERPDQTEQTNSEGQPERPDQTEQANNEGQPERPDQTEQASQSDQPMSQEQLLSLLSEENRMDLEQGREQRRQKQNRMRRRRQVQKILGRTAAVLIVMGSLFGVAMNSDASRRLIINAWEGIRMNFNFQVAIDNLNEEASVRSKSKEEVEALNEIGERLGIPVIDLEYIPEGMTYLDCDIMEENVSATLFYSYQDKIFQVIMINRDLEGSSYYMLDNQMNQIETVLCDQNLEAEIWETNLEEEQPAYIAEIDTDAYRYILNGVISLDEMKKILNSAYFL
jgi:hypothetical protein